jgi:hypothetical protein
MGAIAALEPTALEVEAGGEATAALRVRNAGSVVDEFTFEAVGIPAEWVTVTPEVLRLLPGSEEQATVTLRPPKSADVAAGALPFGIKVNSREDPDGSVVEEGSLRVAAFAEMTAELLPRTSQGSRRARHDLAVDNHGNERLNTDISAYDDDDLMVFEVKEPGLLIEPGQARFTQVEVRPRKRFWRGPEKTLPFHVVVQSMDGIPPVTVDGTMVQRPVLPKWFWKAVLALLALLLLLLLLWFLVLRPTIETAAADAAAEAASEAAGQAVGDALSGPIADQQAQIDDLVDQGNRLAERLDEETIAPRDVVTRVPSDIRLAVAPTQGNAQTQSFTFGEGETYEMTDIFLQNPEGNIGTLEIRRGTETLLVTALQNFRDLDYHFVVPVRFEEGQSLTLFVDCESATGEGDNTCNAAVYVSGTLISAEPTESPT